MAKGLPWPSDPHLRNWMLFVDGENFTIRAQEVANKRGIALTQGEFYAPDVFVWFAGIDGRARLSQFDGAPIGLQTHAIRAYYYTSAVGDDDRLAMIKKLLWDRGFQPEVFKRAASTKRSKGVDIALATDFLSNAYFNNYDIAVLFAGDGDYVPMV